MSENTTTNIGNIPKDRLKTLMIEVISMERRNVRTKEKNDRTMVNELAKVISTYAKQRY